MNFFRKGLNILILCILAVIVAIVALCWFVDPNRLKPFITSEVKKQTGYQLDIDGHFSWTFYPRIGIKAQGMKITAPAQKAPFVVMQDVVLGMDFIQLLQGQKRLSGDVHIKKLSLMNMQAQNVSADLGWENKVLTISPFSAILYDGWMSATIHGQALASVPKWDWEVQFNRVQLKSLLHDLTGKDSKLQVSGVGQLRMDAKTSGTSKAEFINHLGGHLNFSLTQGEVSGIDLNYLVDTAIGLIKKQPVTPPKNIHQTTFESLTGSMNIKQGVASTDDIILIASAFMVKANGSIDLSRQVIDYNLTIVPHQLEQFKWGIPVDIIGDLQNPTIKLDMLKLNTIIANEQFQQIKEKAEEKLKKLPKEVDNFLQKVFGE